MSRSKNKRKPNRFKGIDVLVKKQAAGVLVCKSGENEAAQLYSDTGLRMQLSAKNLMSKMLAQRLPVIPLPWTTYACVCGRDQDGGEYVTMLALPTKDGKNRPFRALSTELDDNHDDMIAGANELTYLTYGWIASPSGNPVSERLAHAIMTDLGAFGGITSWEREQMIRKLESA